MDKKICPDFSATCEGKNGARNVWTIRDGAKFLSELRKVVHKPDAGLEAQVNSPGEAMAHRNPWTWSPNSVTISSSMDRWGPACGEWFCKSKCHVAIADSGTWSPPPPRGYSQRTSYPTFDCQVLISSWIPSALGSGALQPNQFPGNIWSLSLSRVWLYIYRYRQI